MEGLIASFADVFNPDHAVANFAALFQVILIDLALAGDNAVAVGLAAAALPKEQQRRAIFWGIVLALVLRIAFASVTLHLLQIQGLLLVGGLLLFWVAWRMWSDLQHNKPIQVGDPVAGEHVVAAVSRHNEVIMWFGLVLSVILMGVAASIIARVIDRFRWIAVLGIIIIIFAGTRMIWEDSHNFLPQYIPAIPSFLGGGH